MALILGGSATYPWKVKHFAASAKGNAFADISFTAIFQRVDQDQLDDWNERMTDAQLELARFLRGLGSDQATADQDLIEDDENLAADDPRTQLRDLINEILDQVFVGWGKDVKDEAGNPVEFDEDNKQAVLRMVGMRRDVHQAWLESLEKGKRKNSSAPSGTGR